MFRLWNEVKSVVWNFGDYNQTKDELLSRVKGVFWNICIPEYFWAGENVFDMKTVTVSPFVFYTHGRFCSGLFRIRLSMIFL